MATHATPFGAAAAGGANSLVAGEAMSISSKLMTVLTFATVFSIILIAIFVINIIWTPAEDTTETCGASEEEEEGKCSEKGTAFRNYVGVALSIIMLVTLVPSYYFTM